MIYISTVTHHIIFQMYFQQVIAECYMKRIMLYPVEGSLTVFHVTMKTLLLVAAVYTPILSFWEEPPSKFRPSVQFSYTLIPNNFEPVRKHIFLDMKVNTL